MNYVLRKSVRALCLVPFTALCLSAVQAQTSPAMPASDSMSQSQMQMKGGMMGSDGMKKSMMAGMDGMQKMPMTGDTDKDFAMMMKMHHEQALNMAKMELDHGKSPEMKAMAKQIIATQRKEIDKFDHWLAKQK